MGPPETSGTREAFAELALESGCMSFDLVRSLAGRDRDKLAELCWPIRADGAYIEAGEDDEVIAAALEQDPSLIGIFGYHFYDVHRDRLQAIPFEGVHPDPEGIATARYLLSRPLYVYFKRAQADAEPAIARYITEITSDDAWSDAGYLKAAGMVPMLEGERQKYAYIAQNRIEPGCPPFCR